MTNNETVALAIQTLLDDKKPIKAKAVSELSGIAIQILYTCESFRPYVRKQSKHITHEIPTEWLEIDREEIEQTVEAYSQYITDSYFFHPETIATVLQDMLASVRWFRSNTFNDAVLGLIRTGALIEAKPRGKDDIARYVWADSHKVDVEAPAAPVASNPPVPVKAPAKPIKYKNTYSKDRVEQAAATLIHRISEYVTDAGEDDPEILKLEEFARATLKKIQKVGA